ncbi:uncharacterized protein LOC132305300 [Cornus florida]|uniref:uncharacterized protein LOC132305300 n=1 Tax=Cornus florida TaxID=4283 RepID=UPI00289E3B4B|nr:uncharacterized protein LOC132305300 [Cornus florida]
MGCQQDLRESFSLKEGCRPFIGLDGCFLKTPYNQILLNAVGRDGDSSFYLIALAVVEAETKDSWDWFMEELMVVISPHKAITWISDRQKGLVDTLASLDGGQDLRFCVRHLHENFKKKYPGMELKQMVWNAANAFNKPEFEKHMHNIRELNGEAYDWLCRIPFRFWTKSKFTDASKCCLNSNNMCESWNSHILKARDKPIITMFEMIRRGLMSRFHERREYMEQQKGLLCPAAKAKVLANKKESKNCVVYFSSLSCYDVQDEIDNESVNLQEISCTCGEWNVTGIPCKHAIAVMTKKKLPIEEYVDAYHHRSTFLKGYAFEINPLVLRHMKKLSLVPLIFPITRKPPGRPKKARMKVHSEEGLGEEEQQEQHKEEVMGLLEGLGEEEQQEQHKEEVMGLLEGLREEKQLLMLHNLKLLTYLLSYHKQPKTAKTGGIRSLLVGQFAGTINGFWYLSNICRTV